MIVSAQTYNIILIVMVILIALRPLYTRLIKKEGNKHDWMFLLLFFLLPINWYTPTFITVTSCNNFTKEVLLFPTEKEGMSYSYGWCNYVINKSQQPLAFEYVYYGDNEPKEDEKSQVIQPHGMGKVNEVVIDFILKPQAKSVSTKSSGATKTSLYCL